MDMYTRSVPYGADLLYCYVSGKLTAADFPVSEINGIQVRPAASLGNETVLQAQKRKEEISSNQNH